MWGVGLGVGVSVCMHEVRVGVGVSVSVDQATKQTKGGKKNKDKWCSRLGIVNLNEMSGVRSNASCPNPAIKSMP